MDAAAHVSRYFDDLAIGDTWTTRGRTVTETDLVTFAAFSGDYHPLHTDEEYARTTQFGTRILHAGAVLSIGLGLEARLPFKEETVLSFLGMNWTLQRPVVIGDTITVRERVSDKRESETKPDRGIVTFDVQILNQRDETCQAGQWLMMFKRRTS